MWFAEFQTKHLDKAPENLFLFCSIENYILNINRQVCFVLIIPINSGASYWILTAPYPRALQRSDYFLLLTKHFYLLLPILPGGNELNVFLEKNCIYQGDCLKDSWQRGTWLETRLEVLPFFDAPGLIDFSFKGHN